MLIRRHDGFLSVLLVGLLYAFLGSPWFREGAVGWLCLLCWYFDFPSILFLGFFL